LLADDTEAAVEAAQAALKEYTVRYERYWLDGMRAKLGLQARHEDDKALVEELLAGLDANGADFTLLFQYLSLLRLGSPVQDGNVRALFRQPAAFDHWVEKWRARLRQEGSPDAARQARMQAANPVYIPRNHRVEAAIRAAEDHGDFSVFHELHEVLQKPYQRQPGKDAYRLPPEPHEVVQQTFCGT
jgi:uncharacterized protein YdiU (UPF0061 family)